MSQEDFPSSLPHPKGAWTRDPFRLLVVRGERTRSMLGTGDRLRNHGIRLLRALRVSKTQPKCESTTMLLEQLPRECAVECIPEEPPEKTKDKKKVNNTPFQSWVRFSNEESSKRFLRALRSKSSQAKRLDLTATPVFQLCEDLKKGRIAPLPNILIIKPVSKHKEGAGAAELDKKLKTLGLVHHPRITKYLGGYRYYSLARKPKTKEHLPSAYQFVLDFESTSSELYKKFKGYIDRALLDYVPLFVPNAETNTSIVPNDYYYRTGDQLNLREIGAATGWALAGWGQNGTPFEPGKNVVVAVIDSGVDLHHEDLEDAFVQGATFKPGDGWDYETGLGPVIIDENPLTGGLVPDGDDTHGTCCAGIIAARYNSKGIAGLAGECKIMPLRLATHSISTVACAINYAAHEDHRADVISMSFGGDANRGDYLNHELVDTAIKNAHSQGVVLCAAAMNTGENKIYYPAAHEKVIACGACDDKGARTNYSNGGKELNVVAPGNNIATTTMRSRGDNNGDYTLSFEGTSAATPHVAALAALLISKYPKLRTEPNTVCQIISTSADQTRNGNSRNNHIGHGRINVEAAFKEAATRGL